MLRKELSKELSANMTSKHNYADKYIAEKEKITETGMKIDKVESQCAYVETVLCKSISKEEKTETDYDNFCEIISAKTNMSKIKP